MTLNNSKYKNELLKEMKLEEAIINLIMKDNPQAVKQGDRIDNINCPSCDKPEAFIYLNNILQIHCNRQNKCGVTTPILEVYPDLNSKYNKAEIYLIGRGLDASKFNFEQGNCIINGEDYLSVCFIFDGIKCHRLLNGGDAGKYRFYGEYKGKIYPALLDPDSSDIWITESIIDALSLSQVGCNAIATLSATHLPKHYYLSNKDKTYVIAFDNDIAGNKATEKHLAFFKENAVNCLIATPKNVKDWNEALVKGVLDSDYLQSCMQENYGENIPLLSLYDPTNMQTTVWLVKGYITKDSITLLFGESGSYKSFLAIDIACSVATGKNWQGQKTVEGDVIYICGEGKNGIQKRIMAWQLHHDTDKPSIHLTNRPVYILDKSSASEITDEIQKLNENNIQPKLIVIDTLARCFGAGDENGTSDMSKFLMHLDKYLRAPFKVSILIVHHTGHTNTGRARGSYALHAGVDTEFLLQKKNGVSSLSCIKMKEDELSPEKIFKTNSIDIGLKDGDGIPYTSLILEEIDGQCCTSSLSPSEEVAYDALCHMIDGKVNVSHGDWLKNTGQNKSAFSKAVKVLMEEEYVQMEMIGANKYYCIMNDEDL